MRVRACARVCAYQCPVVQRAMDACKMEALAEAQVRRVAALASKIRLQIPAPSRWAARKNDCDGVGGLAPHLPYRSHSTATLGLH